MKVVEEFKTSEIHSIEWGYATWNPEESSIRNRYDNANGGRFNKAGSSEIPWEDFKLMIIESIKRNHLNNFEISEILIEISNKLKQYE